jgi:hypothetical protein
VSLIPLTHIAGLLYDHNYGYHPDDGKASYPLMTEEESHLMAKPYHEWAPAPFDNLRYSFNEKLQPLYIYMGDNGDLKMPPFIGYPARLFPLYTRILQGMAPISHDRWLERRMDDPENYRILFELMDDILQIFAWLNEDRVQLRMRNGFNHLVDAYAEFGSALNLRREQLGTTQEKLDMAGMCVEYFRSTFTTASNRTHQWLVDRVDELQSRAFGQYNEALKKVGSDQEAIGAAGKKYYECVQDLNSKISQIDGSLGIPMPGFKGYMFSGSVFDLPPETRTHVYEKIIMTKS